MTEPIKEGLKQLLSEAQETAGRGGPEGTAPAFLHGRRGKMERSNPA